MHETSKLMVGGEITWDVVISIGISLVSVLIAFFNLKSQVTQVETVTSGLEDSIEEQSRLAKNIEKDFKADLDKKIVQLSNEVATVTKEIFNLKEHTQESIINDIKELENKLKREIASVDNNIEKNTIKYDNILTQIEAKIAESQIREIENLDTKLKDSTKIFHKRLDELKLSTEEYVKRLNALELDNAKKENRYNNLLLILEKDTSNHNLIIENIRTIIDYNKKDIENIKNFIQLTNLSYKERVNSNKNL